LASQTTKEIAFRRRHPSLTLPYPISCHLGAFASCNYARGKYGSSCEALIWKNQNTQRGKGGKISPPPGKLQAEQKRGESQKRIHKAKYKLYIMPRTLTTSKERKLGSQIHL